MNRLIKAAFLKTLPVMAGYIVLGIGYGIISQKSGYGFWWVLALSSLVYAGSMQFVTVSLLTSGASLITTALTTLMVNARHLFYGISMIEPYKHMGRYKPYLIFALTDETYSLVCTGDFPKGMDEKKYCFCVSLMNQLYWILGGVLGTLAGAAIRFNTRGIEFAMTALFVTVFVEQWSSTKNHWPAVIGVVSSIVCLLIFGSDGFLIPAMILISFILSVGKKYMEKEVTDSAA